MGPGVGLEVGNSIYFDMPPDQFAYWNTDEAGREMVLTLMRSGHVDCLHSYGDLATTRGQASRALEELVRHGCQLEVWIDHGTAATNFDPVIMYGHGDEPGHEAYHADLTTGYGVKYVWRGRVTSITGQDVPARLGGIFHPGHPVASGRTLLKEAAKRKLARAGNTKYSMHGPNESLRQTTLRDGSPVYEFMRCNPYWGGVSSCDQGRHIGEVLTESTLNRLIERGGTCILYTHLGKIDNPAIPFEGRAVAAFRRLAEKSQEGKILVTTTRRVLGYRRALRKIAFRSMKEGEGLHIEVCARPDENSPGALSDADLDGMTFYVPNPWTTRVTVNQQAAADLKRNPPDHTGQPSISLAWRALEFPRI